jgi:glycosyltransferase involved in cell wall biosynthesis
MRALLIGPALRGGEGVYMNLLRSHPPSQVAYVVVGGFHSGAPGAPCQRGYEIALNRLVVPRTIPIGIRALRLRDHFDLVHAHSHPTRLGGLGTLPLVMSEGSSLAVYLGEYLGWPDDRLEAAFARTRRLYRAFKVHDRLLASDRVSRAYVFSGWARDINVRWGADAEKLDVVPPGFPTPSTIPRGQRDTFTFLFVGTDFERKGGFDVVEAFERVSRENPHARLVHAGSDPHGRDPDRLIHGWVSDQRRARVLAKLEHLERRGVVRGVGAVSSGVLQGLYAEANAFVMPTLAEGFGFTNVEAMSHGLPVVSSRVGPIPEMVAHEKTGLLVSPGDVDALAFAMSRLISDRDLAYGMGRSGRETFLRQYTLERFRSRLAAVYRRALEA